MLFEGFQIAGTMIWPFEDIQIVGVVTSPFEGALEVDEELLLFKEVFLTARDLSNCCSNCWQSKRLFLL
jgi:hypothetical protein